jgi:hypothetical protein
MQTIPGFCVVVPIVPQEAEKDAYAYTAISGFAGEED